MYFVNQFKQKPIYAAIALLLLISVLAACTPEPETVLVTRIITEQVEVEVTRPVEITRIVEVEVTREVEVMHEVTRIVENVVTATPEPTLDPTETPIPTEAPQSQPAAAPAATGQSQLLTTMKALRKDIEQFGGMIDGAVNSGSISCQDVVTLYDEIAAYPTLNVAGSSVAVQNAHASYRQAVSIFTTGASGIAQNCRDFLNSASEGTTIPFQQWGAARQQVNTALEVLNPAIGSLEG